MDINNLANITQILSFLCDLLFGGYVIHILSAIAKGIRISRKRAFLFLAATALFLLLAIVSRALTVAYFDQQPKNMDLQAYCMSLGYQGAQQIGDAPAICLTPLTTKDLNKVCVKKYGDPSQTLRFAILDDSTSGYCEDAAGNKEQGVDLDAYCSINRYGGSSEAVPTTGGNWQCQFQINRDNVCAWMYGTNNIQARIVNVTWSCYKLPQIL